MLATLVILAGTLLPANELGVTIVKYDKAVHFLMFGVWTFLYGMVLFVRKGYPPALVTVFILGSAYGLLIELLQYALPTNRSPELLDFIADMLGAAAAILVLLLIFRKFKKPEHQMA